MIYIVCENDTHAFLGAFRNEAAAANAAAGCGYVVAVSIE